MSDSPTGTGLRRRLGAVLFADIADYSRMMGEDEVGTVLAVKQRLKIVYDASTRHHGEVIQVRGDGAFLIFDSAVDAISFALELQRLMAKENSGVEPDRVIRFRVGINLGEIIFDAEGVSGDSVNIAARIEPLAPPGSVCVTRAVYDQTRNKVAVSYEYLGPKSLKNIAEPVDVFLLREDGQPATMTAGFRRRQDASEALRDLSAVVLPFKFQGDDPSESWFALGMTEDITTSLSRFKNLFVISRASAFVFRGQEIAPQEVAREFGVRYVLTGSIQKAGRRIRASVQLVDAIRDRVIWGEHYSREIDDIFDLQDEITQVVVAATAVQIESSERERTRMLPPSDLRAYGYVLQGQQHIFQYSREENRVARGLVRSCARDRPGLRAGDCREVENAQPRLALRLDGASGAHPRRGAPARAQGH